MTVGLSESVTLDYDDRRRLVIPWRGMARGRHGPAVPLSPAARDRGYPLAAARAGPGL